MVIKMLYRTFPLILILLTMTLIWTPPLLVAQASPGSKEKLNADLLEAAKSGQTEKVLALIKAGADVNVKDKYGFTALMGSAGNGQTEAVKALIEAKADVNAKDKLGNTALIVAVRYNYTKMVHLLKSAGAKGNP